MKQTKCFTVMLKRLSDINFCLTTALQVVDQADTTEPEQTEALHLTPGRDDDDLKTDETDELHDKQSPRSPPHTEKVMLLKYRSCAADLGFHTLTEDAEMQGKVKGKTMDRAIKKI